MIGDPTRAPGPVVVTPFRPDPARLRTCAPQGSLTTVDELPGQAEIRRENLQRLVEVTARLEGVDLGAGIAAVQQTVADLKLPPSIRVEYGGTYREKQKSFRDLTIVLVL